MSSYPVCARTHRRRNQRGAAVVEAALVISFFLIPTLVGVLTLGERLWLAQKHPPYEPRVASSEIVGRFTCAELVARVKTTVVNNAAAANTTVGAEDVVVEVVEILPTVGVVIEVSVTLPPPEGFEDPVVSGAMSRLDNVSVTTASCL